MSGPKLTALTTEELATLLQKPASAIDDVLVKHKCPRNPDGTWKFLTVLAWTERKLAEHYRGAQPGG